MRKVILFMIITLDGYVGGPNGELDWMVMDEEMDKELIADLLTTVDTVLVGRKTYQGFQSYWPNVPNDPANPPELIEFAHWMESAPKIVFSKTLDKVEWTNSTLAKGDVAEEVAKLKQQPGNDMVIFGGASIVSTFVELDLVDEFRLKVHPVVLGDGLSLWKSVRDRKNLKLIHSKSFDTGVVALYYQPDRKG